MEIIMDQKRKENVLNYIHDMPEDIELSEKKIKINNLEQAVFIRIFISYFKMNLTNLTKRILRELFMICTLLKRYLFEK